MTQCFQSSGFQDRDIGAIIMVSYIGAIMVPYIGAIMLVRTAIIVVPYISMILTFSLFDTFADFQKTFALAYHVFVVVIILSIEVTKLTNAYDNEISFAYKISLNLFVNTYPHGSLKLNRFSSEF